mmetsp:Transcript_13742/g.12177  ORF Transcript_13742/g.12177 Transcript_13742/m.12177 type:complete len:81 (+) Transcript_13742:41-283(+)
MIPFYLLKLKTPPKKEERAEALQAQVDLQNEILVDCLLTQIFERDQLKLENMEEFIPLNYNKENRFSLNSDNIFDDSTHP